MKYLRVRNWDKFQHYKNRRPTWVKLYTDLLRDLDFERLTIHARLLYVYLLLLAAEYNNAIPNDSRRLCEAVRMRERDVKSALAELAQYRYISGVTRKPSARRMLANKGASLEKEKEKESNTRAVEKGLSVQAPVIEITDRRAS